MAPDNITPPPSDVTRTTLSVVGIALLIGGSFWVLSPFIPALLWATMIVVATWPVMLALQARLGGRRGPAVAAMTIVLLLVLFVPLYLAVSTVLAQSDRVVELLHTLTTSRAPPPPSWLEGLPLVGRTVARRWAELAALEPDQLAQQLTPYVRGVLSWFAAKAGGFGGAALQLVLTVLISAILYARGESASNVLRRFFRRLSGARGDSLVSLSGQAIRAVALGIVITALLQTAVAGGGLLLVGVPFAGVIAAVIFILCIAQLGPLLPMIACVAWLYASDAPGRATALLVIALVAQVGDNVIRPLLIRRGADLSLLLIIPGVIGGLLWLGVIGLFIGPVILAVTSTLLDGWMGSGNIEDTPTPIPVRNSTGTDAAEHGSDLAAMLPPEVSRKPT